MSTVNYAIASDNEWTVTFNADMRNIENYSSDDLNTSAKTDEILCDLQRTANTNLHASITYTENEDSRRMLQGGNNGNGPPDCHPNCTGPPPDGGSGGGGGGGGGPALNTMAAIGLSGGYIYNALDG